MEAVKDLISIEILKRMLDIKERENKNLEYIILVSDNEVVKAIAEKIIFKNRESITLLKRALEILKGERK
jgi:ABC-type dipeptide/oligopeptide/nickel transport system ATPase subunit